MEKLLGEFPNKITFITGGLMNPDNNGLNFITNFFCHFYKSHICFPLCGIYFAVIEDDDVNIKVNLFSDDLYNLYDECFTIRSNSMLRN